MGHARAQRYAAKALLTPEAVRERANMIFAAAEAGQLSHFAVDMERLPAAADYVAETIRQRYPDLKVPFHARWRHFVVDGVDRWAEIARRLDVDAAERVRIRFDLAITSVLLDAGAGPDWRYTDRKSGRALSRSEGLAIASLDMFRAGVFSADPAQPLRADATRLRDLDTAVLARGFQATRSNPLDGLEGRARLMRALGAAVLNAARYFPGRTPRVGDLFDYILSKCRNAQIPAREVLVALLHALGPIWPDRASLGGLSLGDTWHHPAVIIADDTDGLMPFHKLSQWLAYSLIEPLQETGLCVTDTNVLTGLAEYRNGGLFIDLGVLSPLTAQVLGRTHEAGSETIVEWRALTIALLDRLAPLVRERLGVSEKDMPLAAILEGGTWAAGRRIAGEKRRGGPPPITIAADGTVF